MRSWGAKVLQQGTPCFSYSSSMPKNLARGSVPKSPLCLSLLFEAAEELRTPGPLGLRSGDRPAPADPERLKLAIDYSEANVLNRVTSSGRRERHPVSALPEIADIKPGREQSRSVLLVLSAARPQP